MIEDANDLDLHCFEGLVGELFRIGSFDVELKEVLIGPETPPRFRNQFSLLFRYPDGFPQDTGMMKVSHPRIGTHDMFVNKVVGWEEEFDLEVVFN